MFKSMGRFFIVALSFLLFINLAHAGFRAPPIPARIGGTVTVDGTQLTQASAGTTYTFKVTRPDGTDFLDVNGNPAEDTDGLSSNGWYLLDIPMYDATDQPNGANAGDQAVIHVYRDGAELTVTNPAGGAFQVDESGANTQMDLQVTSTAPPVAVFSAVPTSGTVPLEVQFTDNSTGEITSRSWKFGDNETSTSTNPTHTYQKAGIYTVELTATGPGGSDTETKSDYITVQNVSAPTAAFSATPTSGAAPLEVQFTDNSTGDITSRSWDFGDSQTSTETNPKHTYQKAGRYTVELTVTGPGGSDAEAKTDYITAKSSAPWLGVLLAY